jgi:hypothetical protein
MVAGAIREAAASSIETLQRVGSQRSMSSSGPGMRITKRTLARTALFFAVLTVAGAASPTSASADERLCGQLRAELASAPAPEGSPEYRKFAQAVTTQRDQIMIARRRAQHVRCGVHAEANRPECAPIDAKIEKMERNLASLESRLAELTQQESRRPDRSRILAALDANHCGDASLAVKELPRPPQDEEPARFEPRNIGGSIEIVRPADEPLRSPSIVEPGNDASQGEDAATARPVRSFSIIAGNPPSDKSRANSPTEKPPVDTGRSVEPPAGPPVSAGEVITPNGSDAPSPSGAAVESQAKDIANVPARPEPGSAVLPPRDETPQYAAPGDEETIAPSNGGGPSPSIVTPGRSAANSIEGEGHVVPGPEGAQAASKEKLPPGPPSMPEAVPHDPGQRKVRVVGPTFLPTPEAAIDLRAPVRKQAR